MDGQVIVQKLDDVKKTLNSVNGKVDELVKWQAQMIERCSNHMKETTTMQTTLYGKNGRVEGLVVDVQRLKNCKEDQRQTKIEWRGFWGKVLSTLVTTGIILVVLWLMSLYKVGGGG